MDQTRARGVSGNAASGLPCGSAGRGGRARVDGAPRDESQRLGALGPDDRAAESLRRFQRVVIDASLGRPSADAERQRVCAVDCDVSNTPSAKVCRRPSNCAWNAGSGLSKCGRSAVAIASAASLFIVENNVSRPRLKSRMLAFETREYLARSWDRATFGVCETRARTPNSNFQPLPASRRRRAPAGIVWPQNVYCPTDLDSTTPYAAAERSADRCWTRAARAQEWSGAIW